MTTKKMKPLSLRAELKPGSFDPENNTMEVVFATETPVRRWDWDLGEFDEVLAIEDSAIRWDRIKQGASVLNTHSQWNLRDVLGVTLDGWIEGGKAIAKISLSNREDVKGIIDDIKSGIIKNVSVGYRVNRYMEITEDGGFKKFKAIDWTPCEISFVPVPADHLSQSRSKEADELNDCEIILKGGNLKKRNDEAQEVSEETNEELKEELKKELKEELKKELKEELKDESEESEDSEETKEEEDEDKEERSMAIIEACRSAGFDIDYARNLIANKKLTVSDARKEIINKIAQERNKMTQNASATIVADERDQKRSLIENALSHRMNVTSELLNEARPFRHLSLVEMFKELDPSVRSLSKVAIARRAMASGDLPLLLENISNKMVAKHYQAAPRTFLSFCNKVNLPDYKTVKKVNTSLSAELKHIAEGGEYEYGSIGEGAEEYHLSKFGRKLRFTEEMFINDDLGELNRMPVRFTQKAAALESRIVYAILTGAHKMSDGKTLFHADHGNLGTAGAISETTINEAYTKFAAMKDGEDLLNIVPRFLVTGQANRADALKIVTALTAVGKTSDVNIYQNAFDVIVDANITGKEWFMIADPAMYETIDIAYLDGMEGPEVVTIPDLENDAIIIKCKHVFAAKAVDHRTMFKNPRS